MNPQPEARHWDDYYGAVGHTGYAEQTLYRYDQRVRIRAFGRALDRAPEGSRPFRALDIGCGTGDVTALLRGLNYVVTATDISAAVVHDTKRRFTGDDSVKVITAAADEAPVPPGSVDLITSVTVLQHIMSGEALESTLSALRTALRPDGRMIALEIAPSKPTGYVSAMVAERSDLEWRSTFEASGFSVESVREYSPWGPLALHQFDRLVGRVIRTTQSSGSASGSAESAADTSAASRRSIARRFVSGVFRTCRQAVLWSAWPLDHVLHVPGPRRIAYYRIYTLRPDSN